MIVRIRRRVGVGFSLVTVMCLAAAGAVATPGGGARTLVLDLPERQVIVELAAQDTEFLLQPVTGDKTPFYTIENAKRIADALDDAGAIDLLPIVLQGMAFQRLDGKASDVRPQVVPHADEAPAGCDLVLDVEGKKVVVPLHDHLGYALHPVTGERFIRFSVESGRRVGEALADAGFGRDAIVRVLVGLRRGEPPAEDQDRVAVESTERSHVPCDTCRDFASYCPTLGDCCLNGDGCTQCTVCR